MSSSQLYRTVHNQWNVSIAFSPRTLTDSQKFRKERDLRFKKLFDVLQFYQLNSDWSLLHFAAYYKYEVNIESFPPEALENVQNSHRTSVLHVAASTGNIQLIRTLLKFLPDVYIFDSNNQTVMHYAMLGTAETVAELIQMPAFYEQLRYRDRLGNTPVDIANQMAKLEIFKILLTQGLTIKLLNLTLPTLFTSTSDEQDSANGRSTEVNVQEFYQDSTPYVQFEPKELADDFDIYSVHYGGCPLHWIDKWSTLKRLFKSKQFDLNYRNRIGDTPLLTLIKRIGLFAPMNAAIPAFIKFDPVPTSDLSSQCTLSTTSWLYLNSTAKSVSQSPDRFVWILRFLSRNADINASDVNGNTALHYAVFNCDLLVVKFLIMFGASLTATNKQNQTPLQLASKRMNEVRSLYNIANLRDIGGLLVMDKTLLKSASHVANSTQLRILWKNYLRVVCALHSQSTIEGKDCRTCKKVRPEKSSSYDSIDSLQADADYKKSMVVLNQFAKDLHKLLDSGNVDNSNGSKKKMEIEGIEETLLPNMLCLDGGMNLFCHESLIQSQILLELQQHLAEPLQSYFQIYTGNGFGAITAALLAINRNPNEIFTFYLKLREKVKLNCSNDSVLETLLQEEFGTEMTLKDVETNYKHHLVVNLIRVDTFPLPLVCMSSSDEKFNTWKLWEVCRASGAGTTMYSSYKDYSDSSILSENPTVDSLTYYYGYMEDKNVAEIPELKEWLEKAPTKSEEAESSLRPLGIVLSIGSSVNYPTDSDSNELKCEKSNPSSQESIFGTENLSKIQDLAMNILTDGDNHVPERFVELSFFLSQ